MNDLKQVILVLACLGTFSCANSKHATAERDFRIELYSYGGIAGDASGVTVTGDGWARLWNGRTAVLRSVRDSMQIDPQRLATIDSLAASEAVSAFHSEHTGNITTVLIVQREGKFHEVSFSGDQVPDSFPQSTKNLISELKKFQFRQTNTEGEQ